VHEHCIFKNGIHLGECGISPGWALAAEHGRNRFLLTGRCACPARRLAARRCDV